MSSTRLPAQKEAKRLAIVALVEEEAGLVLAAGGDAEADAMFRDDFRRRRLRRPAIERFLLLNVLLGEPVETGCRDSEPPEPLWIALTEAIHAGGEKLQHDVEPKRSTTRPLRPSPSEWTSR